MRISRAEANIPQITTIKPDRPDETPKTFADLKPPGYWCNGHFVPVKIVPEDEFDPATGRHVGPQPLDIKVPFSL